MKSILIINGPNLNLLGQREPEIYGSGTIDDIEKVCMAKALELDFKISMAQSNVEGEIVNLIHSAINKHDGIIINAGAYTHTSISIMDAIAAVKIPTVEVHISNLYQRENFRHKSYIGRVAIGQICGFGVDSYKLAMHALENILQ
tara:strand:- start:419 stop:853 length:435 start_codon:yes stop_codon:yes gene_type:complete